MEEKIKDIILVLAVIVIASLGYYYYQSYTQTSVDEQISEEITVDEKDLAPSSGSTVSTQTQKTESSSTNQLPTITEDGIYLVYYFNEGFSPKILQIRQGSSVRFVNKSDHAMRVFTTNTSEYRFNQLNQTESVGKDGTYDFTFLDKDVWTYFNQDTQTDHASILVY
ncbi:hypothetical protein KKC45_01685 [Patescibacteria group bacterium]|nr:hypothetical protein [Patescibacteria group bacterium]